MILDAISHPKFSPNLSTMKRMLERHSDKFLIGVGAIAFGAIVWGSLSGAKETAGLVYAVSMSSIIVTILLSIMHDSKTSKMRFNNYTQYLSNVPKDILIENYHSPEHDNATKNFIKEFLNTHHRGWSISEQITVDEEHEFTAKQCVSQSNRAT